MFGVHPLFFTSTNLSIDLREWGIARIGLDVLLYIMRTVSRVWVICTNQASFGPFATASHEYSSVDFSFDSESLFRTS